MSTLLLVRVRGDRWLHEPVLADLPDPEPASEPESAPEARAVADG
jgi:hypothetical protein